MATTYTDNLNLQQPDLDDDALITVINNDMAIIDQAVNGVQDGLAIVANGNTHVAISAGQFVYVRNHTTLTEGLYVASSNIAANATLSTSNLTADSAGGLNALNSKITPKSIDVTNSKVNSDGRLKLLVSGGVCYLRIAGYANQAIASEDVLCVIPEGYRPSRVFDVAGFVCHSGQSTPSGSIRIDTSGNVVLTGTSFAYQNWFFGYATWMIGV